MRTVLAYPGNMAHAQHAARAVHEAGCLDAFVTTFAYRPDGALARALASLPSETAHRLSRQLARRTIDQVPTGLLHTYPMDELVRSVAIKVFRGGIAADLAWDRSSHRFDRLIARRYVPHTNAIQCFEYTALGAFEAAQRAGVARILHLPSLDSRQFEDIQEREKANWPELRSRDDAYFRRKFERRYERRCREIALADVVIANSSLTARSHIEAGADPAKVFAVPLGAPPAIDAVRDDATRRDKPLSVLWAGPFSIRKGAHYLLQAWQLLDAGRTARLDVYGSRLLPERLLASIGEGITFHGPVAQPVLFEAYEAADVLVFPTLSDGFGMVVAEAMAHGLPVITTSQAGAAQLITPENGMIVPPADPRALADALRWCLDNRQAVGDMRHRALAAARHHQWSDYRRKLIEALEAGLQRAGYTPRYAA